MPGIDLHMHSIYSDGTDTPTELVEQAVALGLTAMSVTDHDSLGGIQEAKKAAEGRITMIPGIELSVAYGKGDIHLLGYGISLDPSPLSTLVETMKKRRGERNQEMIQRLRNGGYEITWEEVNPGGKEEIIVTRAQFASALVKKGYVKDNNEAFRKLLGSDSPYYVPREFVSPKEAIQAVRESGGVPVLAHPFIYGIPWEELKLLIGTLTREGMMGLEVYYSSNNNQEEAMGITLAKEYGLVATGGSDYHGGNKPGLKMGSGWGTLKVPEEVVPRLLERKTRGK